MNKSSKLIQKIFFAFVLFLLTVCQTADAQIVTEWIGGDGLWSDQSMWTFGAPDDSEEHDVFVDIDPFQESIVSGAFGAILNLTVEQGDTVKVGFVTAVPGSLSVLEIISNNGTIEIEEALFGFNQIIAASQLQLAGTGTIVMHPNSRIEFNEFEERTFVNFGNTIEGTGEIVGGDYTDDFVNDMANSGTINANVPGLPLRISARVNMPEGTIGASNRGYVLLDDQTRVSGGTFATDATGSVRIQDTVLILNAIFDGNIELADTTGVNSTLILGGLEENRGEIKLDTINTASLGGKRLLMRTDITLAGGGAVTLLSDDTGLLSTIGSEGFPGNNLTLNNVDNTIQGSGSIGDIVEPYFGSIDIENSGDIIANVDQQELVITSATTPSSLVNTGNMKATMGGQLGLRNIDINNAGGTIAAEDDSQVKIGERFVPGVDSFRLTGGTLTSTGTGRFVLGGIFEDVTMDADCEFRALTLDGTIVNSGMLHGVSVSGFDSNLSLNGTVSLSGGGTVCLADVADANESVGAGFFNEDNTISGSGDLFADSFNFAATSVIAPGNDNASLGSLEFTGAATVDALIEIEVVQPGTDPSVINQDPSSIDVIRVVGGASVGATFELNFLNQLTPEIGDFFDVFSADSISQPTFTAVGPSGYSFQAVVVNLPEGGGGNRDVIRVTVTDVPTPFQSTPDSFDVTRGVLVSGTVADLAASDNMDVSVRRGINDLQGVVRIDFEATTASTTQSRIDVTVESSVFARSRVDLEVLAFNYRTGQYDSLGTRQASRFSDSTETFSVPGDPADYVESGDMKLRTRYVSVIARQQFSVNIDQVLWTIVE